MNVGMGKASKRAGFRRTRSRIGGYCRVDSTIKEVTSALDDYRLNDAAQTICITFFWDSFCDWYIELTKSSVAAREVTEK
jgi:valyl-tRNA synthetase